MTNLSHHFPDIKPDSASRREFLRRTGALSVAASATPWAMSLAAMGEAAAQTASDYKALVCIFMMGGNDYANTVVPYDQASYDAYSSVRGSLTLPRNSLSNTVLVPTTNLPDGRSYALAPSLSPLMPIFYDGALTVGLNVGTLVAPLTKAQYNLKSVPTPPKLFSHNDQQSYWQSIAPEGASSGWGGRMGDLLASGNGNSTFTCVSVSGNSVFLSGNQLSPYSMPSSGPVPVAGIKAPLFGSSACSTALQGLMTTQRTGQLMEGSFTAVTQRSINSYDQLAGALGSTNVATTFPGDNTLASQLQMVAKMIAARNVLGVKRQVFFVSMGNFDFHSGLGSVGGAHANLLGKVGSAMATFYQATKEMGVANQVTTFTASDFGRTLTSNGDGTDHGWGSMHFAMGGAVKGKSFFGTAPVVTTDGPDDVGQGRLLPTTSVEQFGGTMAKWFGVSPTNLLTVMPNLQNFSNTDLGFMAA